MSFYGIATKIVNRISTGLEDHTSNSLFAFIESTWPKYGDARTATTVKCTTFLDFRGDIIEIMVDLNFSFPGYGILVAATTQAPPLLVLCSKN